MGSPAGAALHAHLEVVDVNCIISYNRFLKRPPKQILANISFDVVSGSVLAIMGPSGAGKTQLLNLVALRKGPGVASGTVTLNGEKMAADLFRKYCSFVPQFDNQWALLTCEESLDYCASFFLSISAAERKSVVEKIIAKMGLASCKGTRVGNIYIPGLSGGQRKRLSIALALLKRPLVIFLDEPTSGLDSAAAASIMKFLKTVAVENGVAVCCTIHQPSSYVFQGFDNCLLLSGGHTAFLGASSGIVEHFDRIGLPIGANINPADFMLDVVNRAFTDGSIVDKVLDAWRDIGRSTKRVSTFGGQVLPKKSEYGTGFARQLATSFRRQVKLLIRDPTMYVGRMVLFVVACCFFSCVYIKSRERTQQQAQNRLWLMLWHLAVPSNLAVVAVFTSNLELSTVKQEYKEGTYHPLVHVIASTLIQVPMLFVLSACTVTISGYGICNWQFSRYHELLAAYAIVLWCFECLSQVLGVLAFHPLLGLLMSLSCWFAFFLFSGMIIAEDNVPMPLRLLSNLSPMKWGIKALTYIEFSGTTWEGAEPLGDSFHCPNLGPRACLGYTGEEVLKSLKLYYDVLSDEDDTARNLAITASIAASLKIVHVILVLVKCTSGRKIVASVEASANAAGSAVVCADEPSPITSAAIDCDHSKDNGVCTESTPELDGVWYV